MKKEILYSLKGIYRENFEIEGYSFGGGEKSACIVGALRGNEIILISTECFLVMQQEIQQSR